MKNIVFLFILFNVKLYSQCTGSVYCSVCTNCSRCKYCRNGVCSVCSPNSFKQTKKITKPKITKSQKAQNDSAIIAIKRKDSILIISRKRERDSLQTTWQRNTLISDSISKIQTINKARTDSVFRVNEIKKENEIKRKNRQTKTVLTIIPLIILASYYLLSLK